MALPEGKGRKEERKGQGTWGREKRVRKEGGFLRVIHHNLKKNVVTRIA
jgi:hypothetical protein